jgi:hypothetical protein
VEVAVVSDVDINAPTGVLARTIPPPQPTYAGWIPRLYTDTQYMVKRRIFNKEFSSLRAQYRAEWIEKRRQDDERRLKSHTLMLLKKAKRWRERLAEKRELAKLQALERRIVAESTAIKRRLAKQTHDRIAATLRHGRQR